ncbi:MAG: hypothetical protein QOG63_1798 [Thermoleophilaceae bacterium]|nr:hypothetical protein [Thermoleophilaceae bacterium]
MLLDLEELVRTFGLRPRGVLHLGAHEGEEASVYERCGIATAVWVEGNPELVGRLRERLEPRGHRVLQALVSDTEGESVSFNVTNNSQSSSILALGTHRTSHPEIHVTHSLDLTTTTIDELAREHDLGGLDLMNLDLQGAELRALRGAGRTLGQFDYVYTEVNSEAVYEGCALIGEIDAFLAGHDLRRVATRWTPAGWGDALYVRGGVGPARRLAGWFRYGDLPARVRAAVAAGRSG